MGAWFHLGYFKELIAFIAFFDALHNVFNWSRACWSISGSSSYEIAISVYKKTWYMKKQTFQSWRFPKETAKFLVFCKYNAISSRYLWLQRWSIKSFGTNPDADRYLQHIKLRPSLLSKTAAREDPKVYVCLTGQYTCPNELNWYFFWVMNLTDIRTVQI